MKILNKLALAFLVLAVTACGGGSDSTSTTSSGASTPNGTSALAPGVWRADSSIIPATGNYVILSPVGQDYSLFSPESTYTANNALLQGISSRPAGFTINIIGNENFTGEIQMPLHLSAIEVGIYQDLRRYPFHNPVIGGLTWGGNGLGCNRSTGWLAIDSIQYEYGIVKSIELRFEQFCEGSTSSVRGQIRWRSPDTEGPTDSNGYWKANPTFLPASGNYIHMSSQTGDYIGQGTISNLTANNALIGVALDNGLQSALKITVNGNDWWYGYFKSPASQTQLTQGIYQNVTRYEFANPVFGGMDWYGAGRGCNSVSGWFIVDTIIVINGIVTALDLRFEQHCDTYQGATQNPPALHGQIHWRAP
jgi:hypothetical protein